ncbi:MAG: VCBS repeat-containing protein [Planctomycetota bacterium]
MTNSRIESSPDRRHIRTAGLPLVSLGAAGLLFTLASCGSGSGSFAPVPVGPPLDVSFDAQAAIESGVGSVRGSVVLDLDGDGVADLAALGENGNLVISLSQGGGVFVEAQTLAGPSPTGILRSSDVDLDGDIDLCVVSAATGETVVYRNDGSASFTADPMFVAVPGVNDMIFVDLDGDDAEEMLIATGSTTTVAILQAIGDGSFVSPRFQMIDGGRGSVAGGLSAGDFNGDGSMDFAFADADEVEFVVALGDGVGGVTNIVRFAGMMAPFATAAADLDGDGTDELFGVDALQQLVSVYSIPSMSMLTDLTVEGLPVAITVGDVVGDALPDLTICLAQFGSVAIAEGVPGFSGSVDFAPADLRSFVGGSPFHAAIADLDNDGRDDLAVASFGSPTIDAFFGTDDGSLTGGRIVPVPKAVDVNLVVTGRFDPSSTFDVATAAIGFPGLVLVDFGMEFVGLVSTPPVQYVSTVELPGDDLTDLIVSVQGGVQVLRNITVPGDFSPQFELVDGANVISGQNIIESKAADVDGDGVVDIVAAVTGENRVAVARGSIDPTNGSITFSSEPVLSIPVGGAPAALATGDFDGDLVPEIAVTRIASSRISFLSVTGGALVEDLEFPVAIGPTFVQAADLDGDGDDELVVAETTADQVSVLDEDGTGNFNVQSFAAGDDPTALVLEDLSNDGNPDLVITEFQGSQFQILLGDGSGGFGTAVTFEGPSRAVTADLADANGDGLPDLVIGGFSLGGYGLFQNSSVEANGAAPSTSPLRP